MASSDVSLRIGADLAEFKAAMTQAAAEVRKFAEEARKSSTKGQGDLGFGKVKQSVNGALAGLRSFAASLASIYSAAQAIRLADDFANLQGRLKLVTKDTQELAAAQERLFQIAQSTGQGFSGVADLYARLAQATKEAGTSQEALLQITETINQAVSLSGASSEAASAALTQLGQGLASGTLRGDELNSVLEQTPMLADAIAKGMGITRGELRKYGEEGKITAESVVKALLSQRDAVAEQAKNIPLTFGRAATQLKNSALLMIGTIDQVSGATGGLAATMKRLADYLASDEVIGAVVQWAASWSNGVKQIGDDFARFVQIISNESSTAGKVIDLIGRAFTELPINIRAAVRLIVVSAAAEFDRLLAQAKFVKEALAAVFTEDTVGDARKRLSAQLKAIEDARASMAQDILNDRQKAIDDAAAARAEAEKSRAAAKAAKGDVNVGKFKPAAAKTKSAADAGDYADAQAKLIKDASDRAVKAIEALYEDASITAAEYISRRTELQLAAIDDEIAAEQKKLALGGKDKLKAETEITLLERRKTDILVQAERDRAKIAKESQSEAEQLRIKDLEISGQKIEALRAKLEAEYRETMRRLEAEGDAAGVALARKIIDKEILTAEIEDARSRVEKAFSDLADAEKTIATKAELGIVGQTDAESQLQGVRAKSIEQINIYVAALEALYAKSGDPALLAQIEAFKIKVVQIEGEQGKFVTQIKDAGREGLGNFFNDLVSGAKTFGDALRDLVRNFAAAVGRMAADALAADLIGKLFGKKGEAGGSGLVDTFVGWLGSLFHQGGIVGQGGIQRMVNPLVFAGAPRYHSGGMVGLAPNEVPAILQKGEEVLSRTDPRNAANGGGSSGYRIINVIDPSLVEDYMNSAAGEKSVMNVIGRNPGGVRQIIGG